MNACFFYLFIGLLLYPATMDMWYRVCYQRKDYPQPTAWMYGGFAIVVLFWPLAFPYLTINYLKEMS